MIKIDISTEEKKKEVYNLFMSFHKLKDIFNYYNVVRNTYNTKLIHNICDEIGFDVKIYKQKKPKKYCLYCGKELNLENRDYRSKFCNSSCAAKYNNSQRTLSLETKNKISDSLRQHNNEITKNSKGKRKTFRDRLFESGLKEYKCECCGISEWQGKPITLQVHHINGNHFDNSLENIQILCPNCHSQTDNYCAKNRSDKKQIYYCSNCGKELQGKTKTNLCNECYNKIQKKNSKCPSKEILENDFKNLRSLNELSKKYNVCARTIRKWLQNYNLFNKY